MSENTLYKCTVCGRIGNVGRCCGDETRRPLNNAARAEIETCHAQPGVNTKMRPVLHDKSNGEKTMSRIPYLPMTEALFTDWMLTAPTPGIILLRFNMMEADLIETRKALKMLYQWVKADIEHFDGWTPDDFIIEAVEAAIKKAEEVEEC